MLLGTGAAAGAAAGSAVIAGSAASGTSTAAAQKASTPLLSRSRNQLGELSTPPEQTLSAADRGAWPTDILLELDGAAIPNAAALLQPRPVGTLEIALGSPEKRSSRSNSLPPRPRKLEVVETPLGKSAAGKSAAARVSTRASGHAANPPWTKRSGLRSGSSSDSELQHPPLALHPGDDSSC